MYSDTGGCAGCFCPGVSRAQCSSPLRHRFALFASPPLTPTIPNRGFDGYEPEHCGYDASYPVVGDELRLITTISTATATRRASATTSSRRPLGLRGRLAGRTDVKLPRPDPGVDECPRHESNMRTRFRKPLLYPLSYGGFRPDQAAHAADGRLIVRVAAPDARGASPAAGAVLHLD